MCVYGGGEGVRTERGWRGVLDLAIVQNDRDIGPSCKLYDVHDEQRTTIFLGCAASVQVHYDSIDYVPISRTRTIQCV